MLRKKDIARIIHDRYRLRGGIKIPLYLGEWMVDYVFSAIQFGLIEDGCVDIANTVTFERVDVPEHKKRMPDDTYVIVPFKSKVRVEKKERFASDVTNEVRKRNMLGMIDGCINRIDRGTYDFSAKELVEIQRYLNKLSALMAEK